MKCRYNRRIYEKESSGYCVYTYLTDDEGVPQAARNRYFKGDGIEFSAVGTNLPSDENIEVDLTGKWVKNPKYGFQLSVEAYTELLPQTEEGIKGYLASGMIKGIGPQMAERIVGRFGTRTFEVFENYPDSLLEIKGISQKSWIRFLSPITAAMPCGIWQPFYPHSMLPQKKYRKYMKNLEMKRWRL